MVVRVDIFTSAFCQHSAGAINVMKKIAPDFKREVDWNEISIETGSGKERAKAMGVTHVPTIVIDGRIVLVGMPSKSKLTEEITKRL
jgi:glutaredoxin